MFKRLKNKINNWLNKEEEYLNQAIASKYRQEFKKQCPFLFKDDE
jgi:hypothetical protein